jgi:hypothetical protein
VLQKGDVPSSQQRSKECVPLAAGVKLTPGAQSTFARYAVHWEMGVEVIEACNPGEERFAVNRLQLPKYRHRGMVEVEVDFDAP